MHGKFLYSTGARKMLTKRVGRVLSAIVRVEDFDGRAVLGLTPGFILLVGTKHLVLRGQEVNVSVPSWSSVNVTIYFAPFRVFVGDGPHKSECTSSPKVFTRGFERSRGMGQRVALAVTQDSQKNGEWSSFYKAINVTILQHTTRGMD
jgi:hypothetical protein